MRQSIPMKKMMTIMKKMEIKNNVRIPPFTEGGILAEEVLYAEW